MHPEERPSRRFNSIRVEASAFLKAHFLKQCGAPMSYLGRCFHRIASLSKGPITDHFIWEGKYFPPCEPVGVAPWEIQHRD